MIVNRGLVYIFTGDGKGKTSAALGVAVRAILTGMKVGWVSWYKEKSWLISERKLPSRLDLEGQMEMYFMGRGFYKLPTDKATPAEHKQAAEKALKKAEELLQRVEVLVMDEVIKAVADELITEDDMIKAIEKRGKTHVVLTGRGLQSSGTVPTINMADLVTECKKIKHPFDIGIKAVRGLDY